jgi:hypothetical protein
MKNLIITALLVLMATSCESSYITVMDTEDGHIMSVRKKANDVSKLNDTLVLEISKPTANSYSNTNIYGKFINKLPEDTFIKSYFKVIRLR